MQRIAQIYIGNVGQELLITNIFFSGQLRGAGGHCRHQGYLQEIS